jgi:transposase
MSRIDVRVRTAILCAVNTLLPVAHTGRPRADPSAVLDRMALLLWSGGPWRTLGAGYTTVFQTFTQWTAAGVFERAYATTQGGGQNTGPNSHPHPRGGSCK